MADYNQQSGNMRQDERRPVSTYNAHQDEFGFKEGNDYPAAGGGYGDHQKFPEKRDESLSNPGVGGGYQEDPRYQAGYGDRTGKTFQDAPERMTGYGDTESGVGGPKSGYGASKEGAAYDRATSDQTQFGFEGETGYGHEGSDPQLGATDTGAYGAVDPLASDYDTAPRSNTESVPGGDGWSTEDASRTHGAKKDGLVNKIKEKMPGQHHTATGVSDPNSPPKNGIMGKIKEKLPGHHGSDAGM